MGCARPADTRGCGNGGVNVIPDAARLTLHRAIAPGLRSEGDSGVSLRVIVAEDETIIRMDLTERLQASGYQVVGEAGDGESAVKMARELRPDVVVMDIRMPEMDGIEAARRLTDERIAPVVLVTSYSDRHLISQALEAGAINYVLKPLRDNELEAALEVAMSRYREFLAISDEVE